MNVIYHLDIAADIDNNFDMDDITLCNVENQVHKVIYENLYEKFQGFL